MCLSIQLILLFWTLLSQSQYAFYVWCLLVSGNASLVFQSLWALGGVITLFVSILGVQVCIVNQEKIRDNRCPYITLIYDDLFWLICFHKWLFIIIYVRARWWYMDLKSAGDRSIHLLRNLYVRFLGQHYNNKWFSEIGKIWSVNIGVQKLYGASTRGSLR